MSDSFITKIGIANPTLKLTQQQIAEHMALRLNYSEKETRRLVRLYKKTNIEYRHITVDPSDASFKMPYSSTGERMKLYQCHALEIAKQAICSTLQPDELAKVTHLITVSCTGMYAPGLDIELTLQLNLSKSIERTCINFMGCYGAFNALKMADYICSQDPKAYVLIVCVELCTLHFQAIESLDQMVANAIFADGAACALIHGEPQTGVNLNLKSFQCSLAPNDRPEMAWYIGDKGFDIILSSYVPLILANHIHEPVQKLLTAFKLKQNQIDYYAIHPGGKEILSTLEKMLNISPDQNITAHEVLRNYGNMSSPTILFVLKKWMERFSHEDHHKNILAMAFGPGLTIESALLSTHWV
jgi:alpha-pyrone synthase